MQERRVRPGEVVIREGEQGDYFFALDQGRFIVTKEGQVKFCYEGSGSFGELALLYNSPRAATVTAETEGVLWALDRASFRSLVINSMIQRRKRYGGVQCSAVVLFVYAGISPSLARVKCMQK